MAVKKESIISENGFVDVFLRYIVPKAIKKEEEYDKEFICQFLNKIKEEEGDSFAIAKVIKRMEEKDYPTSYIVGVKDILTKVIEVKIPKEALLIQEVSKSIAKEISKLSLTTTQLVWDSPAIIDLTNARDRQHIAEYPNEEPDCLIYLPDSTGTGTIYFDSPTGHEFPIGTDFWEIRRHPFRSLYLTNEAQSGRKIYLLVGKGDVTIQEPTRLQGQYRPVIAKNIATLGANATYTSSAFLALNFDRATFIVFADQASAANGLQIQQSMDASNWDYSDNYTVVASTGQVGSVEIRARYVRIRYTNGGVAQGAFRLEVLGRVI